MFARWKKQTLKSKSHGRHKALSYYAIIVESCTKNGKPSQRLVTYVGGIREKEIQSPFCRKEFWERAEEAISKIKPAPDVRAKIESKFLELVPKPSRKELLEEIGVSNLKR